MCQALFCVHIFVHTVPSLTAWLAPILSRISSTITSRKFPFIFPSSELCIYLSCLRPSSLGNFEGNIALRCFVRQMPSTVPPWTYWGIKNITNSNWTVGRIFTNCSGSYLGTLTSCTAFRNGLWGKPRKAPVALGSQIWTHPGHLWKARYRPELKRHKTAGVRRALNWQGGSQSGKMDVITAKSRLRLGLCILSKGIELTEVMGNIFLESMCPTGSILYCTCLMLAINPLCFIFFRKRVGLFPFIPLVTEQNTHNPSIPFSGIKIQD